VLAVHIPYLVHIPLSISGEVIHLPLNEFGCEWGSLSECYKGDCYPLRGMFTLWIMKLSQGSVKFVIGC
jgi:hypothetical protein